MGRGLISRFPEARGVAVGCAALGLFLACASQSPPPSSTPSLTAGTTAARSSQSPEQDCALDQEWETFARLPPGFTGNAGIAVGPCEFSVVGELVDRGTGAQVATILDVRPGKAEIAATFQARTFWDIAQTADGQAWVAGETFDGSGLLLWEAGEAWEPVPVPAEVGALYRILSVGDRLIVASMASDAAVLSSYSREAGWVRIGRIPNGMVEGAPGPGPPSLHGIAARGQIVAVAGTDGFGAVVLVSNDGGVTFEAQKLPNDLISVATSAIPTTDGLTVSGYRRTGTEAYAAAVLTKDEAGWHEIALPEGVGRIHDAAAVDESLYLIAEVAEGAAIFVVTGSAAERERLDRSGIGRFISPSDSTLSVIGQDLYSRSVP